MTDERTDLSEEPQDDRLRLPPGAFIAFRQSGGLRFRTREVSVYHDGHLTSRHEGQLAGGTTVRRITPAEVADLQELITLSGLFELPGLIGRPNPDAYAYELIARLGPQTKRIEFFDNSIPSEVGPLVRQLKQLFSDRQTSFE